MDYFFESEIDWDSGPKAIEQLFAGFFYLESDGLWKLIDADGNEVIFTHYQKIHIKDWRDGIFMPVEDGRWKVSFNNYADDEYTILSKSPVPTKADAGYTLLLCINYHGDARTWDTIEFVCVSGGVWQAKEFWKTLSEQEKEEDAEREKEWRNSPDYFKMLEDSSRYDNHTQNNGYNDEEDNIMRGLDSANGDLFGF